MDSNKACSTAGLDQTSSLCLCYIPFFAGSHPEPFLHTHLSFCAPAGNTMMIVVESMSNGALDSFLRVCFDVVMFLMPKGINVLY